MKRLFIHHSIYLLYCRRLVIGLMVLVPLLLSYGDELRPQPLFAQSGPTNLTAPVAPAGSVQRLRPGQVPSGLTATSWASIQSQIQQSFHVNNASPEQVIALSQQAYAKASNTEAGDQFGWRVAVAGDTVVIGALTEDSNATGVNGNQADNSLQNSGAAYVFVRNGASWSQQAYLKASNTEAGDQFGESVAIAGDTIVVGARSEDSNATGFGGNQSDNSATDAGAAYLFVRSGTNWSQRDYIKASNTGADDEFGVAVGVANETVVVGTHKEDSNAIGVDGANNDVAADAGASYLFHMPNNFGVTVTNVKVNGSSQSAAVKPDEIFTVTLDYHVYDANCPTCIKQIVFGYSSDPKPRVCV